MPASGPETSLPRPAAAPARSLTEVAAILGLPLQVEAGPVRVTGVTHDSRAVRAGDLYVALPGARAHGADFAAEAVRNGAVAVLTDPDGRERATTTGRPVLVTSQPREQLGRVAAYVFGRPTDDLLLLGVTGTNGKTTTAYLLDAGLRAAGRRTGLIGTIETRIGDQRLPSLRTTPEATDLQALFAVMRERGVDAVAMEISSHALALGRVGDIVVDVALFTNLSQDHLDFHRDLDDYFAAKAALFTPEHARQAVVTVDDKYGRRLAATATIPVITVSAAGDPHADWRAEDVQLDADGSTFQVVGPRGTAAPAAVRLPGGFNVTNALGALVTLHAAGVPVEVAAAGVAACPGVPGRMELVDAGQPFLAVVDYAHTPEAVETLLRTLRQVTAERLFVVLGCGGDRDRAKRPLMGAAAASLSDAAILTSDNPRSEDPSAILDEIAAGAARVPADERAEIDVIADRGAAIEEAVRRAGPGDTVVVAGKGHEQGQEIAGVMTPFDDRLVLLDAIARREAPA